MIGLINHIYDHNGFGPTLNQYKEFVKDVDTKFATVRGWDFDAIVHYGELTPDMILADIGGGCSYFSIFLSRLVKETWCIDGIWTSFESFAISWLSTLSYYQEYRSGKARIHIQNAKELPFPDNSLDRVITISALEHFQDDDDILCAKEVYRVLKPGGIFIGTVDFHWYSEYPAYYNGVRFYTYESFLRRIKIPSNLELCGKDYLENDPLPDVTPETEKAIQAMFFKLRKC